MRESGAPIRLGIVDNDALSLAALRSLLTTRLADSGLRVVWAVRSGEEAVALCLNRRTSPDIVLVDMGMDRCDGQTTCNLIRRGSNRIVLLAITCHSLHHHLEAARHCGAQALLDKADIPTLCRCLLDCMEGRPYIHQGFPSPTQSMPVTGSCDSLSDRLSVRETTVMNLTVEGYTAREIAVQLGLGEPTIKTYIRRAIVKLGVDNKPQAIRAWNRNRAEFNL